MTIVKTYHLFPSPISRHEVLEAMDSISCVLLKWHIIKIRLEIGIRQVVMHQSAGILKPDIILHFHPRWNIFHGLVSIILQAEGFPGSIAKRSGINCIVHIHSLWKCSLPWVARDTAHKLRRRLMSPADHWFQQNRKLATSNWRWLSYGVCSSGPLSELQGGGCVLGWMLLPSSSQIHPTRSRS